MRRIIVFDSLKNPSDFWGTETLQVSCVSGTINIVQKNQRGDLK